MSARGLDPPTPILVISAHLDDAALSCGHLITAHPGTTVVTVFTDAPDTLRSAGWNSRTTGRLNAAEALATRRFEDRSAMRILGARWRHLGLWESEYVGDQDVNALAPVIATTIDEESCASVIFPVGLTHPDHIAVSDACMSLVSEQREIAWFAYADLPYAHREGSKAIRLRLTNIERNCSVMPLPPFGQITALKVDAVERYTSQVPALRRRFARLDNALLSPERYWRVR